MERARSLRIVRSDADTRRAPEADADPCDLAVLFRDHARYVAAVALRILGRDEEVDDIVQEVFLAAIRGLREHRSPEAVRGWLARVTVRQAGRRLRFRRLRRMFGLERAPGPLPAHNVSAEDRVLVARVYEVLDTLPVEQRIAWALRHVEGEPLDSVARLCGCSLATAKRRIAAAHAVLEKRLADG